MHKVRTILDGFRCSSIQRRARVAAVITLAAIAVCATRLQADDYQAAPTLPANEPLTYAGQPLEHWSRIARRELQLEAREPAYKALAEFARRTESRDQTVAALQAALPTETSTTLLESGYRTLAAAGTPAALEVVHAALIDPSDARRDAVLTALSKPTGTLTLEAVERLTPDLVRLLEHPAEQVRLRAVMSLSAGLPIPANEGETGGPLDSEFRARLTRALAPALQPLLAGLDSEAWNVSTQWAISLTRLSSAGVDLATIRPALEERLRTQLLAFDPQTAFGVREADARDPNDAFRGREPRAASQDQVMASPQVMGLAMSAALVQRAGGDSSPGVEMLLRTADTLPEGSTNRRSLEQLIAMLESGEFLSPALYSSNSSSNRSGGFSSSRGGFGSSSTGRLSVDEMTERARQQGVPEEQIELLRQRFLERQGGAVAPRR